MCSRALRPLLGRRRVTVCARGWPLLEPFEGLAGRPHRPLGRQRAPAAGAAAARPRRRLQGISIHERLLTPATVAEIRDVADLVMTWPANAAGRARELVAMGVDGLITDRLDLARELVPAPTRRCTA